MDNNEEINLNEQYKNIVNSTENSSTNEPADLGSVNMERYGTQKAQDADLHLGYHDVPLISLPSGGMFYQEGTKISIRPAKVSEIRHYSTIDENNVLDIDEKLNAIVESCIRITSDKKRMSYKDILEEDRFYIILSIRDLTFPEPESNLKVDHLDKKGNKHEIVIDKKYFQYFKIPKELDKYYDNTSKTFLIETKSFGTIEMKPPCIGVMQKVTDYIKKRQEEGSKIDQSLLQVIPFLTRDWRGFNEKSIFDFEIGMNGWSGKKYNLVYTLAEKMKIGVQPNMLVTLGDDEEEVPISFRDGIKSLFVIQDITGELL